MNSHCFLKSGNCVFSTYYIPNSLLWNKNPEKESFQEVTIYSWIRQINKGKKPSV